MRTEILLNDDWNFHKGDINVEKPYWKGPVYSQSKTQRKQMGPAALGYLDIPDNFVARNGLLTHERWEKVNVPHDFIVDQNLSQDENNSMGYLHYDNAWYRKKFYLPKDSEMSITLMDIHFFHQIVVEIALWMDAILTIWDFTLWLRKSAVY